jgi:hypothetical protein
MSTGHKSLETLPEMLAVVEHLQKLSKTLKSFPKKKEIEQRRIITERYYAFRKLRAGKIKEFVEGDAKLGTKKSLDSLETALIVLLDRFPIPAGATIKEILHTVGLNEEDISAISNLYADNEDRVETDLYGTLEYKKEGNIEILSYSETNKTKRKSQQTRRLYHKNGSRLWIATNNSEPRFSHVLFSVKESEEEKKKQYKSIADCIRYIVKNYIKKETSFVDLRSVEWSFVMVGSDGGGGIGIRAKWGESSSTDAIDFYFHAPLSHVFTYGTKVADILEGK